jgi:hypothetical protein
MRTDLDLYLRFDGYDELKPILAGSDEDVLVALRKPTLIKIPGTDPNPRARFVSALLHGNEDSGYRAVLGMLRTGEHYPFDLWVFIGNVRAAHQEGWFAHRYLDGQEDFNRTWGLNAPTTRMRRCSDAVFEILRELDLEAAIDIHNNTGLNPYYAITPEPTQEALQLAAAMADTILRWPLRAHTLMEVLSPVCPAVSVETGLPAIEDNHAYAASALRRFLRITSFEDPVPGPQRVFEMQHRIIVREEVRFAFGGVLTEEMDLVLHPGMDHYNFGMLLAGTELGVVPEGAGMPLLCTDMRGRETTDRFFAVKNRSLIVTEDITPVMLTTTVQQTRRDCFFYIARRRA